MRNLTFAGHATSLQGRLSLSLVMLWSTYVTGDADAEGVAVGRDMQE